MDYIKAMKVSYRLQQMFEKYRNLGLFERVVPGIALLDEFFQGGAFDELHLDE